MNDFLGVMKALSDETRFNIINILLTHDFCVRALAKRLNISEAAVSQHLQVLRKAGVVKGEKRGYWTHYCVDREVLNQVADSIKMVASQTLQCKETPSNYTDYCKKEENRDV